MPLWLWYLVVMSGLLAASSAPAGAPDIPNMGGGGTPVTAPSLAGASVCPGETALSRPLDLIDMSGPNAGPFPSIPNAATAAELSTSTVSAVVIDPLTLRVYASATFRIMAKDVFGSSNFYSCDSLVVVPQFAVGNRSAVMMTALAAAASPAALAASSPQLTLSANATAGTLLRDIVIGTVYDYFGPTYELLRVRALLFTDAELVVVTQQDIFTVDRGVLAADPAGAQARVKHFLPLPASKVLRPAPSYPSYFDWHAAVWAPAYDSLFAATAAGTSLYAGGADLSKGSDVFAFKRSGSWSMPPAVLSLVAPAAPVFASVIFVRAMAYTPASDSRSSGRLAFVVSPQGLDAGLGNGVIVANISADGDWIANATLLAGPSLGTSVTGFDLSAAPIDAASEPGALLLSGGGGSRVLWPNGSMTLIFSPSIDKDFEPLIVSAPVVTGFTVPVRAAGPGANISAIMTTQSLYLCQPPAASALCPAGRMCTIFSPPRDPLVIACPRRLFCPANTLATAPQSPSGIRRTFGVLPCPIGSICVENATTPSLCQAGRQCGQNETHDIVEPCPRKFYCPRGTGLELAAECNSAAFCVGGAADQWGRPTGGLCPAGFRCRQLDSGADERLPCPAGSWCPAVTYAGSADPTRSPAVPDPWDSSYCRFQAQLPINLCRDFPEHANCSGAAYWRSMLFAYGMGFETPCACPPGYLCPEGASRPDAVPCPPGMACAAGSAFPSSGCAPGYFCRRGSTNG